MSGHFARAVAVVARHTGVSPQEICARRASRVTVRDPAGRIVSDGGYPPDVAFARQAAVYLAVVVGDMPVKRLAREISWHPYAIRRALRVVEDGRDDPVIDARMDALERGLAA